MYIIFVLKRESRRASISNICFNLLQFRKRDLNDLHLYDFSFLLIHHLKYQCKQELLQTQIIKTRKKILVDSPHMVLCIMCDSFDIKNILTNLLATVRESTVMSV